MKASANEVELHLVVQAIALSDRFCVHYADVVVLHGNCQVILTAVESHTKNLLAFSRGWLPTSNEIIVILA